MAKRKITPHKGGRNQVWPPARLTKSEYELLSFVLENRGMSYSDWVVEKAKEDQDLILRVAAYARAVSRQFYGMEI